MTKTGEALLRKLAEAGVPLDLDALSAKFNLGISPIVTVDVDTKLFDDFAGRVNSEIRVSGFLCELAGIVVFPIIMNPDIGAARNSVVWRRKERAYIIKMGIDFDVWQQSKSRARKKIIVDFMNNAIACIPEKHLGHDGRKELIRLIGLSV